MKFWRIDEKQTASNGSGCLLQRGFVCELNAATAEDAIFEWARQHGLPKYHEGYVATELTGREGDIHI